MPASSAVCLLAVFGALETETAFVRRCPSRVDQTPLSSHRFSEAVPNVEPPSTCGRAIPDVTLQSISVLPAAMNGVQTTVVCFLVSPPICLTSRADSSKLHFMPRHTCADPWVYQTVFHACRAHRQNLHMRRKESQSLPDVTSLYLVVSQPFLAVIHDEDYKDITYTVVQPTALPTSSIHI